MEVIGDIVKLSGLRIYVYGVCLVEYRCICVFDRGNKVKGFGCFEIGFGFEF